ncbi:MAG: LAGLIDADG family homing endonuclease [Candidatus Yanofskybacteria bacterium]|nr:LAGLIDADG family homing endonuclease [Candidatus Yanofskybacteria bacterium]MBI4079555.1 LAGLIDADG family homing endonuclease [Candidatus Levybacteria bacterium]
METTPWEVNGKNVSDQYIAGFLDGDGSIVAVIEKRPDRRRFPYRVRLKINFTQHVRHKNLMLLLQESLGKVGSVRYTPTHNLSELVIQKREDLKRVLERLLPHLILKQRQAKIMLAMIDIFDQGLVNIRSSLSDKDFEKLFSMALEIRKINSGAGGKKNYEVINPVTTQV